MQPDAVDSRYETLRRRWDREDDLLMSRTVVFLIVNSIFATACQPQQQEWFKVGVAVLSLVISFLWLTISWHSFNVIAALYHEAKPFLPEYESAIFRIRPILFRPNTVLGKVLPTAIIVAWLIYLPWVLPERLTAVLLVTAVSFAGLICFVVYAERRTREEILKTKAGMGMFRKRVRASNIKYPNQFFEDEFWVDAGALYSFVPGDYLERIGVEPSVKRNLILAYGRQDTRLLGFCNFEIEGLEGVIPCPVIFAPKDSLFLLGATALKNFGVDVDPIQKTLKPILAVIGGFLASYPNCSHEQNEQRKREGS